MTKAEMNNQIHELEAMLKTCIVTMQYQHELLVGNGIDPKTGKKLDKPVGIILPRGH